MKIELQIPPGVHVGRCSGQIPNMFKQIYLHKYKQIQMQSNTNRITNTTTIACGPMDSGQIPKATKYQITFKRSPVGSK